MISLNLISPEQKDILKMKYLYILIENILGIFLITAVVVAIILIPLNQGLVILDYQNQKNKEAVTRKNIEVTEKINVLNQRIDDYLQIKKESYPWNNLLAELAKIVPPDVSLIQFTASLADNNFIIRGYAKSRDDLIELIANLNKSEAFVDIESPLTNYLQQDDVTFEIKGGFR